MGMKMRGLLLLSMAILLSATSAMAVGVVTVTQPNDANTVAGTIGIAFTYVDVNFVAALHDVSVDVYISDNAGDFDANIAVNDINADTYCGADVDYATAKTCNLSFNTASKADGDWFIDINGTTYTTANTDDQNSVTDSSDAAFTIDNNATTPLIDSPLSGQIFGSVHSITFSYHTSDADIAKYWVYSDSLSPIDNGTNLSYGFSGLGEGSHTLNVKSMDNLDNNSAVASVTITIAAPSTGGGGEYCGNGTCGGTETSATCPQDCAPVCGDGACTGTESVNTCPADCGPSVVCGNSVCNSGENFNNCPSDCEAPKGQIVRETILSRESKGKPTPDDMRRILEAAGASPNAIEKATAALGKASASRKVEVVKTTDDKGKETFTTIVEIIVENISGKALKNVKVVEEIPKQAAQNAQNIATATSFRVLKADPIMEFTVDSLTAGGSSSIKYTLDKALTEQDIALYSAPFVSDLEEVAVSCDQLNCDDSNPCTSDSCGADRCINIPKADGTSCGTGKVCSAGTCIESSAREIAGEGDNTSLIAGIALVIIIAAGAYYFYSKK